MKSAGSERAEVWRSEPTSSHLFGGLPGSGKTSAASGLARRLGDVYLRIEEIEQAIRRVGQRLDGQDLGTAGCEVAFALARPDLGLDHVMVIDSVSPVLEGRAGWPQVTTSAGSQLRQTKLYCIDAQEHRRRMEARTAGVGELVCPSSTDVLQRQYEAWDQDSLFIDTAETAIPDAIEAGMDYVAGDGMSGSRP